MNFSDRQFFFNSILRLIGFHFLWLVFKYLWQACLCAQLVDYILLFRKVFLYNLHTAVWIQTRQSQVADMRAIDKLQLDTE